MLICMELLGIHPLESQYKVTVGNVARPDFLNCHASCDFNRLEAWYTWPIRSQCFLTQGWTNPFRFSCTKKTANCFAVSLMPLSGEISLICCCIQMVKGNACKACYYSLLDAVLITGYFFDYQFDYQMIYILWNPFKNRLFHMFMNLANRSAVSSSCFLVTCA